MNLTQEITRLREGHQETGKVIASLEILIGSGQRSQSGRTTARTSAVIPMPHPTKRVLSAAGRKRIALAQKTRWAKARVVNHRTNKAA